MIPFLESAPSPGKPTSSSATSSVLPTWHVVSYAFYHFYSFRRECRPRRNNSQFPTTEVRFYLPLCLSLGVNTADGDSSQRSHTASIHILDDDSLLNIFYLYRPHNYLYRPLNLDVNEDIVARTRGGKWDCELWWYKLAHVCQRWRNVILGSASYLELCLLCTLGTPVAQMLAHSPPLPIVIDYIDRYRNTLSKEEEILLALKQRDRVRRIRLEVPLPNLQKIIVAIDEEFPMLEYMVIGPLLEDDSTVFILPETFRAPRLRHLALGFFFFPIGSRLLTTAVGLTLLSLVVGHPSSYFQPNILLQWLSLMPQLETLVIAFHFIVTNHDVEKHLMNKPTTTHVALPNLRQFMFVGVNAYLEAVVCRITAPRLEKLDIWFFKQPTFSVPHLVQFMITTNLRFNCAKFEFSGERVCVELYFRETEMYVPKMGVLCLNLDWQVSSVVQIFNSLNPLSSTVEHLTFKHKVYRQLSDEYNEVDRTEWRELLRPFSNVKTLHIGNELVKELSRSLRLDDGELPLELFPELQELTYSGSGDTRDAFKSFIDVRQDAGHPVTLTRL